MGEKEIIIFVLVVMVFFSLQAMALEAGGEYEFLITGLWNEGSFESEVYENARESFPPIGSKVITPDGGGRVTGINIFKQAVNVELKESKIVKEYKCDELVTKVVKPDNGTIGEDANWNGDENQRFDE